MKRKRKIVIVILILIFLVCLAFTNKKFVFKFNILKDKIIGRNLNKKFDKKIKSGNLSVDYDIDKVLSDVDKFQLNTVNVPIEIDINSLSSDDMSVNSNSEKKAIELIQKLSSKNISIILEAYPWIKNGEEYETKWQPKDINKFFYNWKNKVLKKLIDDIAVPYYVDAINVASNFVNMEKYQNNWCDIIDFVKQNYSGLVTYRTSWWITADWDKSFDKKYMEKLNNKLFSKVDFISVAAYFELTDKNENSVKDLVKCIKSTKRFNRKQNVEKQLYRFYDKWKKPIFFGELGFPKRNGAAIEPWNPEPSNIINNKEQARCFEAYRQVFENKKWFLGFSIFAIGKDDKNKNYYPSNESTKIIKNWYKKN